MKTTLIITILSFCLLASAQDKKATGLLNQVSEKTQSFEQIKIGFEYKMINKTQGIDETMEGTLLTAGDKYRLEIAGQQIINDGKTLWTFLESVNEVQINEATDDDEGFNLRSFLQTWSDDFKATFISETNSEALLELTPKEGSAISKVHVIVDKNKKQLLAISMFDDAGNEFIYSIKSFITSERLKDEVFSFNPENYPGLEVIDLR
jgi:outer membrane lipoprotein carrier protein